MTALTGRPEPDLDFDVPTRIDIPAPQYRVLAMHASTHDTTVNAVIAELVRLSITPTPAPRAVPVAQAESTRPTGRLAKALSAAKTATDATKPKPKRPPRPRKPRVFDVPEDIATRMRELRANHVTDAGIAADLGVHPNTVKAWRIKIGLPAVDRAAAAAARKQQATS